MRGVVCCSIESCTDDRLEDSGRQTDWDTHTLSQAGEGSAHPCVPGGLRSTLYCS